MKAGDGVPFMLATQPHDTQSRDWRLDIDGRYWREPTYAHEAELERQRLGIEYYSELDEQAQLDFVNRVCRRLDEQWERT